MNQDKNKKKKKLFSLTYVKTSAVFALAFIVLSFLFFYMGRDKIARLSVLIALVLANFASVLGIAGYIISSYKKNLRQTTWLSLTSIIAMGLLILLFGCLFALLLPILSLGRLVAAAFLLLFIIPPLSGIIACVIKLREKSVTSRANILGLIFLLGIVFILSGRCFIVCFMPYIYAPPALTEKNLSVFKECIKLVKNHNECQGLGLLRNGVIILDGTNYLSGVWPTQKKILREIFTEHELIEISKLAVSLDSVMCFKFQRHGEVVVFCKTPNSVLPMDLREFYCVFPTGHGVLYSLNGKNPNDIDNEVLNESKPFTKIYGNWYTSRTFLLAGCGSSVPKSLIDHSLRIEGLNLD